MQSIEIVVFEAADPDAFADKQAKLHAQLSDLFDGFVTSLPLRSVSEPSVFADVVLWETAEHANAAAAALPETEELAWFRDEIASIRFFDHLAPLADAAPALDTVASAPVVELVAVKPADVPSFEAAHDAVHRRLATEAVIVGELRLGVNANGIAGDVNGWTDAEAMEKMAPTLMAEPDLAPMFDEANEIVLFMPFVVNRP